MTDKEAHAAVSSDPDALPRDEEFWKNARVVWPAERETKETITIRLDADVLRWFRRHKGYQTHINAVLRSYMNANRDDGEAD